MPRQARLDAPGVLQHVIVRGIAGSRIVTGDRDREDLLDRIGSLGMEMQTRIYAWSLLDNHFHLLLRSGPSGLAGYMRRLLTGYAVRFNLLHNRQGHLFQNRYKSLVCQEDLYFHQLICYIHLNPLRARLVRSLEELDNYPWCGHAALLGNADNDWQDAEYVLSFFGDTVGKARKRYRSFLLRDLRRERQPGAGQSVMVLYEPDGEPKFVSENEQVIGSREFAERCRAQIMEEKLVGDVRPVSGEDEDAIRILEDICTQNGISPQEIRGDSRRRRAVLARRELLSRLVFEKGMSLSDAGKTIGRTQSAVSRVLSRRGERAH